MQCLFPCLLSDKFGNANWSVAFTERPLKLMKKMDIAVFFPSMFLTSFPDVSWRSSIAFPFTQADRLHQPGPFRPNMVNWVDKSPDTVCQVYGLHNLPDSESHFQSWKQYKTCIERKVVLLFYNLQSFFTLFIDHNLHQIQNLRIVCLMCCQSVHTRACKKFPCSSQVIRGPV